MESMWREGGGRRELSFLWLIAVIGEVSVRLMIDTCDEGRVYLGSSFALTCEVTGSLPPIVPGNTEWFCVKGTTTATIMENSHIQVDGTRLAINNAMSTDRADYFCRVTNGQLTAQSENRQVNVLSECPTYLAWILVVY